MRRINWMLVTSILFAGVNWGAFSAETSGQSYQDHIDVCTRITEAATSALQHEQWELLVSLERSNVTHCRDLFSGDQEASSLSDIVIGLTEQSKFEEAIPFGVRCITLKPDAAFCYVDLGEAFEGLGRIEDARSAYEQAVSVGGYDFPNASAIKLAKARLAHMPPKGEPRQSEASKESEPPAETKKFGTGFIVSAQGHILTNDHVVAGCRTLATRDGKPLQVLSRNASSDLALLQGDFVPSSVAVFRTGPAPKLGDSVVAFGFPLPGLLSSQGNVSTGIVSAVSGLGNDVRFIQISAPVQPGNSGGPLFDSSGHLIGVVVAKLDAVRVAELTGDIPQNVNFAVRLSEVRAFLDEAGVPYQKEISQHASTTGSIAKVASRIAIPIECTSDGTDSAQSQGSRSQDGQAAGPSLQETIAWMKNFSQQNGLRFFNGEPSIRIVLFPDSFHEKPSAPGCAVWEAVDYFQFLKGSSTASVALFNLSDINPDSVKVVGDGVVFEIADASGKVYYRPTSDPTMISATLFASSEVQAKSETGLGGFVSVGRINMDSPESNERFASAFKHAVILCGGVKSHF
jgi:S1-C subfamily serine protease